MKPTLDSYADQTLQDAQFAVAIKCSTDSDCSFHLLEIIPDIVLGTNIWTTIIQDEQYEPW